MSKYSIKEKIHGSDYFDKYNNPVPENIPEPFLVIINLFEEDCSNNLDEYYIHFNNLYIRGSNKEGLRNELMLRLNYLEKGILVISRVEFINKRQGYMTRLYHLLNEIMKRYNYNEIMIESILTDEMKNWCVKNEFTENFFGDIENLKSTGCFSKKKNLNK